ncbi:MAG: SpoIIE family protein phosphatase [Planctomycetes bacterium]|nr:SpoIIE family protein phosphatase [Planctomycetota bacterium]
MSIIGRPAAPFHQLQAARTTWLWVCDDPPPANLQAALGPAGRLRPVPANDTIERHIARACGVIIGATARGMTLRRISALLDQLERTDLLGLVLLDPALPGADRLTERVGPFVVADIDSSAEILAAHLESLRQIEPAIAHLRTELEQARSYGTISARTLSQLEEELRLAARLQRDFLPRTLPQVAPLKFGIMFRPVGWVSGDMYDVIRLDETHVGFYVADAVGHGMPAALLTMFLKRALPTKRIDADGYRLVAPDEAMAELNAAICEQDLSSCQFCSALYCLVDSATLEMTYARGGHPEGLLLRADGSLVELNAGGGLLGVFPEERYRLGRVKLSPGDRLVLYSDGAEAAFRASPSSSGHQEFVDAVLAVRHMPVETMSLQLAGLVDDRHRRNGPEDDITVLLLDIDAA